ncbi:putative cytochrome P450 [Rosa chinensis]|uniref:Putative cytochrome P450 n=1 Tax=Rosa chinensis TaxID=74649 RepID=A0A2P6R2H0_ROSCH|nr:putative cytochrome P450 [Rosa chinensis]
MNSLGGLVTTISSFLCAFLLLALIKILHKLWWTPIRIQKLMALQGIKGPSYRSIHGNTKEISEMKREAMSRRLTNFSHDIFSRVQPHIHSWNKTYGKNFVQWYGCQAQLVISEPELIKEILNKKDAYPKRKLLPLMKKIFGEGLATTTDPEKWEKLRKQANHAFHGDSLKGSSCLSLFTVVSMIPTMIDSTETMLQRWKSHDGKEIEVYEEFRLLTSEVISKTAFGNSYFEGKNIFDMFNKLCSLLLKTSFKIRFPGISFLVKLVLQDESFNSILSILGALCVLPILMYMVSINFCSKFFKTSYEIESEKLEKGIHDSIVEIAKKREKETMTGGEDNFGNDFLGLLLKAHHGANDKQRISVNELVDECKIFYFAGHETTNALLAWTILLALHPDWQEEARKEVLQSFGKQTPDPDGLAKLKTMSMIINETLRLYAPVISYDRRVEREVRLGNLIIPAGFELYISSLALHHEPQFWGEDVHLFKPERFSDGVAKATNNNITAFLPFGH